MNSKYKPIQALIANGKGEAEIENRYGVIAGTMVGFIICNYYTRKDSS